MVRIHHSPLIIVLLGLALAGATALAFSHLAGPPALPRQTSAASFRPTPARLPTAELNRWFEVMLERHPPPLVQGRRLKLRYMTQAKARPPTFILFGTRAELLPEDYQRYLVNGLREHFKMPGVPIRLQMRGTTNPYADRD